MSALLAVSTEDWSPAAEKRQLGLKKRLGLKRVATQSSPIGEARAFLLPREASRP